MGARFILEYGPWGSTAPYSFWQGGMVVWTCGASQALFQYKPCSHVRALITPKLALFCTKQCSLTDRPFGFNHAPLPKAALLNGAMLPHSQCFSINHALMYVPPCHSHWRSVLRSCAPEWPPFGVNRAPLPKAALLYRPVLSQGRYFSINRAPLHVLQCQRHWCLLVQSSAPPMAARSV